MCVKKKFLIFFIKLVYLFTKKDGTKREKRATKAATRQKAQKVVPAKYSLLVFAKINFLKG